MIIHSSLDSGHMQLKLGEICGIIDGMAGQRIRREQGLESGSICKSPLWQVIWSQGRGMKVSEKTCK